MTNFIIQDDSDHKYYTQIPNILCELGLKCNAIAFYLAIKKSAGDKGNCTKTRQNLCREAGIGERIFPKIKKILATKQKIINKPLIHVTERIHEHGDFDTDLITIVDIWPENMLFYSENGGGRAKTHPPSAELHPGVAQKCRGGRAKRPYKEEPFKNNPFNNTPPLPVPQPPNEEEEKIKEMIRLAELKKFPFTSAAMYAFCKDYSAYAVRQALETYRTRSKDSKVLHTPDKWLKGEVEKEFRYQTEILIKK